MDVSAGQDAADIEDEAIEEGKIGGTTSTGRTAVLVGYGVKQTDAKRRPRKVEGPQLNAKGTDVAIERVELGGDEVVEVGPPATEASLRGNIDQRLVGHTSSIVHSQVRALAKPPVRKLAKDLGVDLGAVTGSGAGGIVTRDDVEAYAGSPGSASAAPSAAAGAPAYGRGVVAGGPGMPLAAGSRETAPGSARETRTPIKGVRKVIAQAMVDSAFTAPHVTEWVTCDVSATMDLVERLKQDKEFRDVKVTPLLILAKAMCIAARRHPGINVSWDESAQEIVTKHYVNLGIAAATPRGLMVPNVKDAHTMPLLDLARAIGDLTRTAREGRTQPADMAGGTITITNVGVFGVDTGTPILNRGEAAIVVLGAVRRMPWVVTGADGSESVEPRWVTQLGMSFDHRVVDGELGSRYLADVAAILCDPTRALVWA